MTAVADANILIAFGWRMNRSTRRRVRFYSHGRPIENAGSAACFAEYGSGSQSGPSDASPQNMGSYAVQPDLSPDFMKMMGCWEEAYEIAVRFNRPRAGDISIWLANDQDF
jgi:hypothetical protein